MALVAMRSGGETMKMDPFLTLGAFGVTGIASIRQGYDLHFLAALLTGGVLALLFSLWKSRQRKADGIDTALWATIALIGTMALAFFLAPVMEGRSIPVTDIVMTKPLAAFLIAVGGTPAIEWLLTGEAFKWAKKVADKFGLGDKAGEV